MSAAGDVILISGAARGIGHILAKIAWGEAA
jgi:NAD(P)-dependent dehydrogenase (short-subunit alcohol dehydrogenase family)